MQTLSAASTVQVGMSLAGAVTSSRDTLSLGAELVTRSVVSAMLPVALGPSDAHAMAQTVLDITNTLLVNNAARNTAKAQSGTVATAPLYSAGASG